MLYQMGKVLFTVVIPSYNRANSIERTIKSVLNQTYKNIELIVIDDGSKDNTKEVIEKYADVNQLRYIYQKNAGVQTARNHGLKEAKGNYILFLDSDDELLLTFVEKTVEKFESDDYGAVYCLTGIYDKAGKIIPARNDYLEGNIYKEVLQQGYLTSTSFIAFRRSCFEKVGEWDKSFFASQDDDMCFRFAKNYKIGFIPEILGIYYLDGGNQIGSSQRRVAIGWWTLWNKYEKDVAKLCGKERIVNCYKDCLQRFMRINDDELIEACRTKLLEYINEKDLELSISKIKRRLFVSKYKTKIKSILNKKQETRNKKQETRNKKQETRNKKQETRNKKL